MLCRSYSFTHSAVKNSRLGGPLVPVAALWTLTTAGWSAWLLRWLGRLPAAPVVPSPVRVPPCANP